MERFEAESMRGVALGELLQLKKKRSNGRYNTTWGDKTPLGLYLTVKRFIEESEKEIERITN